MLLKGKLALVTGSSRGIGAAIAKGFAIEGAVVVVNYNRSKKRGEDVLEEVRKSSPESMMLKFDVSDKLEVEKAIDTMIDRFKRVNWY